ncbi:efflux RND transporter periplasmic adaptor subunit [Xanthobacteraceae bacterium Astr-EGSB]|uniref:efflux RND transporter periplasmic adaptor subunit n=1 Tax=Astrobacterium formosum TaxID=3069710 RepID=UPI0027B348A9|nr:efflux RND transporter periplasmic adaptor subunit [Xanthobacteraceae bacterium Astr-EGSB]
MTRPPRALLLGAGLAVVATVAGWFTVLSPIVGTAHSTTPADQPPAATPVSVATLERRDVALWDEFSGRLEAVERVDIRPRVAGAIQTVHFVEGALVKRGDLLLTIDPAPYAAAVARAEAQVLAAKARLALTRSELDRGRQLWDTKNVSQRDLDQRINADSEAAANLRAAEAGLQTARLELDWTEVRAPVSGRVGRLEVTVGNLVPAGPGGPVLTTLVSIDPIYASFNADERTLMRVLASLPRSGDTHTEIDRIPVRMDVGREVSGYLQLVDNQVDGRTGTVRVRAVFDNPDGSLLPGQFARLRMGRAKTEPLLLVNERAIGTDQDKKFVLVVDGDNKATYREVELGATTEGLRVVTSGLKAGERVIVNGLQKVRPGATVEPKPVAMETALWPKGDVKVTAAN